MIAGHLAEDSLAAFADDPDDPDDPEVSQAFCRTLSAERLLMIAWPAGDGGAGGVLRTCRQLNGAAVVCDEHDVSLLALVQPGLRLRLSAEPTAAVLATAIHRDGSEGLSPHAAERTTVP